MRNILNPPEMHGIKAVSDFILERSGPISDDTEIPDHSLVENPDEH